MSLDRNDYNKGGFAAFVFSMVFSIGFFIYISFMHKGVIGLDQPKPKVDVSLTTAQAGAGGVQEDVTKNTTPWVSTAGLVAHGKEKYMAVCSMCHGNAAMGDGPAGAALNPKPRNLVEGKWVAGGKTIDLFNTIKKGLPGTAMAPFGHLPLLDRWAITHFVRSITKNAPADDAKALEQFAKGEK